MEGVWGLQWPRLLPLLFDSFTEPPPHILLLHLGRNDIGLLKGKALVWQARDDPDQMDRFRAAYKIHIREICKKKVLILSPYKLLPLVQLRPHQNNVAFRRKDANQ